MLLSLVLMIVEVNAVEDGNTGNFDDNEVPSSAELYGASELRLDGDQSGGQSQTPTHSAEHDDLAPASNSRHVTHTGARHRHSSVVTSLQVCALHQTPLLRLVVDLLYNRSLDLLWSKSKSDGVWILVG